MAKKMTEKQELILKYWIEGKGVKETAELVGCSMANVTQTKGKDEIKKIYYETMQAQLDELLPMAIKRLTSLLQEDNNIQASVALGAVREVLDRSYLKELLTTETEPTLNLNIKYE